MQEQANQNMNNQQQETNTTAANSPSKDKEPLGEYIDFEEVK